ncbi:hypothetical protein LPB136_07540 [Tenacibaculum todarodis]|uniref:Heavy metal binding domain-containing protein n=1 Tax=Tenacibaculum todarodis TaxID=1850252 RepID=A0A1L3JJ89_9FLAO|nr:heavy metal-binding domain-containing protein [Tenacibaculum todarodis]APG65206.1 hypothetical protein LPB136_07540 [Tenacibaculum todarodis]
MKKIILVVAIVFASNLVFISCKTEKNEEVKEQTTINGSEVAKEEVYQCPMECEKSKTYKKEGDCPVCKMKLKEKKSLKTEESD